MFCISLQACEVTDEVGGFFCVFFLKNRKDFFHTCLKTLREEILPSKADQSRREVASFEPL